MVLDYDFKWIRPDMSLHYMDKNCPCSITLLNSGDLATDFNKYAIDFFDAAECVIHYLSEDAVENDYIRRLDLWYFAMVYLYRQSMELLLKANIFKIVASENDRKLIIGDIRHDLKQGYDRILELKDLEYADNDNANCLWKYLADISRIDKESDMFRYPFGNNLNVLFDKQTHISLVATHNNMNKAFNILSELYKMGNFTEQEYEAYLPQLIIEGDYYQQSVVGYEYTQRSFYPYYSSYVEVGNFFKEKILNDNRKELFMPMCYMYRNAVELGLKRIIIEDCPIERTKALKILRRKKHSILGLWNSIVDEIDKYSNVPDDGINLNDATLYIQTFHDFDQSSDLFRYPCNKKLQVYFSEEKVLDIENVSSCFEELCNYLDAVDSLLSDVKDIEAEMAQEMASYYDYY